MNCKHGALSRFKVFGMIECDLRYCLILQEQNRTKNKIALEHLARTREYIAKGMSRQVAWSRAGEETWGQAK